MVDDRPEAVPTASEIVAALNNTGFILEYRVAQMLRENDFDTQLNHAYPDSGSGKSREIDILAHADYEVMLQAQSAHISVELLIECKNSTNPFILIGERGQEILPEFRGADFITFDPLLLKFPRGEHGSIETALQLYRLPGSTKQNDFVGRQLIRMNRQSGKWRADNSAIYDSILYPLAKIWRHVSKLHRKTFEGEVKSGELMRWDFPYIHFIFPLVVTAGLVFIVDVAPEDPEVTEVGWAPLIRDFRASDVSATLLADVVSFDRFQEYLNTRIKKMMDSAHENLSNNINLYDPEWLKANWGEPEHQGGFNPWLADFQQNIKRNG